MEYSKFGKRFAKGAGILSLMKDMGEALASGGEDLIMMGGGNPGYLPDFQKNMQDKLKSIAGDSDACNRLLGIYSSPQGDAEFISNLASFLRNQYGWDLTSRNICLTNGSQAGFFLLFNMFGGEDDEGRIKKIRLPLAPEYIGYSDLGLHDDFFVATRPKIELLDEKLFKYRVDFNKLEIGNETGALCVSRPTNPTGNVVTEDEIERLDFLCKKSGVPLIIDNAYGVPFPGIIFNDAQPVWNENIILCLSLSKLGLPAVRTGIIIAGEEIIETLSGMNAIMTLSPNSFGPQLTSDLVGSGEILELSKKVIMPFYSKKAMSAVQKVEKEFKNTPTKIHKPEGAMFLWLWFDKLPISCIELYERLKKRGVLVISGHNFFPGLEKDNWSHKMQCIRVNYSQEESKVNRGIEIIAEEVRKAYDEGGS